MAQQTFNNTKITVEFEEAASRQQLNSGENINTLFGKIKKIFSDLKPVAFSGSYNDLTDVPDTACTDYTSQFVINTTYVNSIWSSSFIKYDKFVVVNANITWTTTSSTATIKLGTLPEELRPAKSITNNSVSNNGYSGYVFIDPNGTIGWTYSFTYSGSDGVRMVFTYLLSDN